MVKELAQTDQTDLVSGQFLEISQEEIDLPLFKELSQTSRDLSGPISDPLKSREVWLNSSKSGIFDFFMFSVPWGDISSSFIPNF